MIGHPQGASGAAGVVTAALAHVARVPAADHQSDRCRIRRAISTTSPTQGAPRGGRRRAVQLPGVRLEEQRPRARPRIGQIGQTNFFIGKVMKKVASPVEKATATGCVPRPWLDIKASSR